MSSDPLAEAKHAASQGYDTQLQRYALLSIATDIRRLVDHITGTTGDAE